MPGAPPRQGRAGSEPYKTFNFNIGEDGEYSTLMCWSFTETLLGNMPIGATLEHVKFEWTGDRSVKLMIRSVTLTFSC